MASLLKVEKAYVESHSPLLATRLCTSNNTVVALKGATTWIACPGQLWSHKGRNSGLATAGSGDVLAGVIAGLAARGATAAQATVWGVVLHALSGMSLRRRHGALGMLARELPHEIPKIMEALRA
jgi:NAD(P)H-hydrate repair Nnr-like enzyme with NAD(P)H-hydrate dehydratase domain